MSGTATNVHRPTEGTAIGRADRAAGRPKVSPQRLAELMTEARWHGDRYGARLLGCLLDRAMGGAS